MDVTQAIDDHSDPRITGEHVRTVSGEGQSITLVGVVHDHPASTYRVRWALENVGPEVLALELPPIAVPLFEAYARSSREPPRFGGEMSAAIQAAETTAVVGIDRPTGPFFGELLEELVRERPPLGTIRDVLSNAVSATKHALICRLAADIAARTSIRLEVDRPVVHDVGFSDDPNEQAQDERTQVRKARSFMDAFQTANATRASHFEDAIREKHMAECLSELDTEGTVVAVVGIDHVEPLIERLTEPTA